MTTKNVLIIDDSSQDRALFTSWLRAPYDEISFHVEQASDADTGFEMVQTLHIDAIILDFRMHEKNGLEFLEMLKSKDINLPIIFATSFPEEDIVISSIRGGAQSYVDKNSLTESKLRSQVIHVIELAENALLESNNSIQELIALLDNA